MASVTLNLSSLNERQLRAVLVAHDQEHQIDEQPRCVQTAYAKEQNGGSVGCIVRVSGPRHYMVTTMPLTPASATKVMSALAAVPADPEVTA